MWALVPRILDLRAFSFYYRGLWSQILDHARLFISVGFVPEILDHARTPFAWV
jgi:hypothetical protein